MNILVTGADHLIARQAIAALQPMHNLRAVDVSFATSLPNGVQQRTGDLRDPAMIDSVLRGVDAVLHVAPLTQPFASDQDNLDHAARGTYQLMQAAQRFGVKQVILLSTLALFDVLPEPMRVGPTWRPHPQPCVADFCAYAAEMLARESVRIGTLQVVCVRVGHVSAKEIEMVLSQLLGQNPRSENWSVLHVGRRPKAKPGLPKVNLKSRPVQKVLVLGAGGPIGEIGRASCRERV